jgi:NTP pyrophosphatase (non-canonical NTP hydrolase)
MTYYLYHITGKKIGVTCNLNNRVTLQQGYAPDEYEVLEISEDIDYISDREIELQKKYGYRIDQKLYKNLKPKTMNGININVTEQTTTFPYPVDKLKGNLIDHLGYEWGTKHGKFKLTIDSISWIMQNIKTSMYNLKRSYIYNKAFANWNMTQDAIAIDVKDNLLEEADKKRQKDNLRYQNLDLFENIREWARVRGLYEHGDPKTQLIKLQEEMGELAKATLDENEYEIIDAIGDMVVVLTNLAHLNGLKIETCITSAYKEISKRKGKMVNGTFKKEKLTSKPFCI